MDSPSHDAVDPMEIPLNANALDFHPTGGQNSSPPKSAPSIPQLIPPPTKHLDTVVALYDFPGTQPLHLPLSLGDTIWVLVKDPSGWWDGVVSTTNGEILRGWFPRSYVRSVNYVQPVLNELRGREVDLITAANTAANVLIPLFASLLQGKLTTGERLGSTLRKNSVVLFSDDFEEPKRERKPGNPSPSQNASQNSTHQNFNPPEKLLSSYQMTPLDPASSHVWNDSAIFNEVSEPSNSESPETFQHLTLVSTYRLSTTTMTTDGGAGTGSATAESISTIPMLPSTGSNDVNLLDVSIVEGLIETYRQTHGSTLTWVARVANNGDYAFYNEQLNIYCLQIPMSTYLPPPGEMGFQITLPLKSTLEDMLVVDLGYGIDDVNMNIQSPEVSGNGTAGDLDLKRTSNALSVSSTMSGQMYHHFSQPLYSMDGLFYKNPLDLDKWKELKSQVFELLDLLLKSLQVSNKQLFLNYILKLNSYVQFIFLACNLAQHDFLESKYDKALRKKLNRLASAYARIYTNGLLHLSMMHYVHPLAGNILSMSIEKLNKSTSQPLSLQLSTVTAGAVSPLSSIDMKTESSPNSGINNVSKTLDSVAEKVSNMLTDDDITYLDQLEYDIKLLRSCLNFIVSTFVKLTKDKIIRKKDYDDSDTSDDEGIPRLGVLPQMYSRFIVGEFNGGNWCNPFFIQQNLILNASGDDLKNRRHSKIILDQESLNQVTGLSEKLKKISNDVLTYLDPEVQYKYYNETLRDDRNLHILRLIYKLMYYSLQLVDTLEAFDFTVFCLIKKSSMNDDLDNEPNKNFDELEINEKTLDETRNSNQNIDTMFESSQNRTASHDTSEASLVRSIKPRSHLNFDYPVVLEFFEVKQEVHDYIATLLMETQGLTLEDHEVFKSMKEDDVLYSREVMKDKFEKTSRLLVNVLCGKRNGEEDAISLNLDGKLTRLLHEGTSKVDVIIELLQQLIEEREMILNYATRVMHDNINVQLLVTERNNTVALLLDREERYYSGKKKSDTPWYLDSDEEYDLLTDNKRNIKGGLKDALVARLTHHEDDAYDSNFDNAFLLTFSTFMLISELLQLLIHRFNIEAPEGLNYDEYNSWISKKQTPIRREVVKVMKFLLEKFWTPLYFRKPIIEKWLAFIKLIQPLDIEDTDVVRDDLIKLLNGEVVCKSKLPIILGARPPAPLTKTSTFVKKLKLLDIDYVELARQLAIREFNLYLKISMHTCIAKVWGRKLGLQNSIDPITKFIRSLNQLTKWVAYMILRKQDVKKRVQLIRYFVQVAEKSRQLNNYSSMTAIILALYSSPIHRLKKTWKMVTPDTLNRLTNMNKLMNLLRNFNEYRDVLKFVGSEPCVPFFGVILSDLTFVLHGNLDYLMNRPWMINFSKRAKTYEIVLAMERYRRTGYNLLEVKEYQTYLDVWFEKSPTIEQQYHISLVLEPREQPVPKTGAKQKPAKK